MKRYAKHSVGHRATDVMNSTMRTTQNTALIVILLAALLIGGALAVKEARAFSPEKELERIKVEHEEVWVGIRDSLSDLIKRGGVEGALAVNQLAFTENEVGMYHCHIVNHLIGHFGAIEYRGNLEDVFTYADWQFCELGYLHGLEAQVVLEDLQYLGRLKELCILTKAEQENLGCYHGVGHAYMNDLLDIEVSLGLCDTLRGPEEEDMIECYKGVFAEFTNLVGGIDGETGIMYEGGPPLSIDEEPMKFCASLDSLIKRESCAYELNGLGINTNTTPEETEQRLDECLSGPYETTLKEACLYNIAAVSTQHQLVSRDTIIPAPRMLSAPSRLRVAYMRGVAREMWEFIASGSPKNINGFCDAFSGAEGEMRIQVATEGW